MKKIILVCLAVIPLCQAADPYASWHAAIAHIPNWQDADKLYLSGRNITALPENLNFPRLRELELDSNQLTALPANFNPLQLKCLYLSGNLLTALPANFNPPQLTHLHLDNNLINDEAIKHMINRFEDPDYLPSLRRLDLSENPITQNAINKLKRMLHEKDRLPIDIDAYYLTGDSSRNVKRANKKPSH